MGYTYVGVYVCIPSLIMLLEVIGCSTSRGKSLIPPIVCVYVRMDARGLELHKWY